MDSTEQIIVNQLTSLVRDKTGDSAATIEDLETLPGHAGFSFSFVLKRSNSVEQTKLVLRLAPPGVKISGPADITKQARIMSSLWDTAVPVPRVLWCGDEPEFFGRPYSVVEFIEGVKLSDAPFAADKMNLLARKGIAMLATLHSIPWGSRRAAFGEPLPLTEELKRLDKLIDRPTLDSKVVARGPELRERLRASIPANSQIGCVHGDFQWANVLFNDTDPIALIDWEIASIGPTLLDVGWVSFFADGASWIEVGAAARPSPHASRDSGRLLGIRQLHGQA